MIESWKEGKKVESSSQAVKEKLAEVVSSAGRNEIPAEPEGGSIEARGGGRAGSWASLSTEVTQT